MNRIFFARGVTVLWVLGNGAALGADNQVSVTQSKGKFRVTVGEDLFCEVDYQTYAKPIVYPIYGPGQVPMTRNYPMRKDIAGEPKDHPHHKSMWFAHGAVNGVSFWDEHGKIINETAELATDDLPKHASGQPTIRLRSRLVDANGELVCRETMLLSFGANDQPLRWIDWMVTQSAGDKPLELGDTKEGTAALRVHPDLSPDNRSANPRATAVNSEGLTGDDVWGKRAKWVDYSGTVEGHPIGIAFFDHPQNLRYPTYWHARGYGLFAANPFGLSEFVGSGSNGTHTVAAGHSLTFRYRIVFHPGSAEQANVEQLYRSYAEQAE
jgi:hypothetical protein